jgi:hypothetical protein
LVRIFLSLFVIAAATVSLVSAGFVSLAKFHRYRDHSEEVAPDTAAHRHHHSRPQ